MTTNLGPWPLSAYPPVRAHATANITPFTYYDGLTYLERLEELRLWLTDSLIPGIDGVITIVDGLISDALENVEIDLSVMRQDLTELRAYVDDAVQQVVDGSIVLQDAVAAGIIQDETSSTRTYLDTLFTGSGAGVYQLDAVSNPTDAIEDRIMDAVAAVPNDSIIVVPVGEYVVSKSIQFTDHDKRVSVTAHGSTFTRTGDFHFIDVNGVWSDPANITGMATVTVGGGLATEIIYDSAIPVSVGSVVKIYSDDPIGDVRQPNDTRFQGEMTEVLSVSADRITVQGKLFDDYSINRRISAMADASFEWRGGVFRGGATRGSVVRYNSLKRPKLTLDVEGSGTIGFAMRSCYQPLVEDCNIADLMNDTSVEPYRLGYAVHDSGSNGLVFRNSNVYRSRHAYTDDVSNAVGADPASFGRPFRAVIENVRAYGMAAGAFSPHHGGVGHRFIDCLSEDGQNTGFSMRGLFHEVLRCTVINGQASFTTFTEGGGSTYGNRFVDCVARGGESAGFSDLAELDRVPTNQYGMEIINGLVDGSPRAVTSIRTRTRIAGIRYVAPASLPAGATAIVSSNGIIDGAGEIELDYRGNTAGDDVVAVSIAGDSARFRMPRVRFRNFGVGSRLHTIYGAGSGSVGSARFDVDETIVDEWPDVTHRSLSPLTIAPIRTANYGRRSGVLERTDVAITNILSPTYSHGDIYVLATMTANVTRVLGSPGQGLNIGQRLTVTCTQTGTATTSGVDITNASTVRTINGSTWRLLHNDSAVLVWNGSIWVMTSCTGDERA